MQTDSGYRLLLARAFLLLCGVAAWSAGAQVAAGEIKEALVGRSGVVQPLQQVIRVERARGPVFVTVPVAYVFGLSGGDRELTYCSPSIQTVNSSNAPIEELIVGIDFQTEAGQNAGSAVARFYSIKIGHEDTQYFYQLSVNNCRGLLGQVSVVRCTYASGEDCARDVRVIEHGTIPLQMKH